jgi:outer membrane protein assembly factor BamB
LAAFLATQAQADWLQFRGTDSTAVADEPGPRSLSATSIDWTAELGGRGLSSPIVVGDRVIVTSDTGFRENELHVRCFDAGTGEQLWERECRATGRTSCHPKSCVAAPSPCSDGQRVFAFYSSNDVVCLDLDGNILWYRGLTFDYPNASNSLGMSSSLAVVDGTLVAMVECDAESLTIGLDTETGETRWKLDRPRMANWTSPIVMPVENGDDLVLVQSGQGVLAIHPMTGETVWNFGGGASTVESSVVNDGVVYVPSNGITALKPDAAAEGGVSALWTEGALAPGTASPIVHQGKLFVLNGAGVLVCADLATGERQWQLRLGGAYSSSPVAAGDCLYCVNEEGTLSVVDISGEGGEIVSTYDLGETVLCTPAIVDGAIYVRSDNHLWKIAES